jgi:glycine/D-amino acid oxidase-like deaminating enzyme
VDRRGFLRTGGAASLGLAIAGCGPRVLSSGAAPRRRVQLVPANVSWDRIIRTTVGLRPYRESGFRLSAERFDDRTLIHNFGHGGSGWSLSWGTGYMAADLALEQPERRAAVIGCGTVGLTTARQLQRRGFEVTIYAASLPPYTTSNMSWAGFTPTSGLVSGARRTPEWDAQFRKAVDIAYREHQLLVGRGYGVSWIDEYSLSDNPGGGRGGGAGRAGGAGEGAAPAGVPAPVAGGGPGAGAPPPAPLLPSGFEPLNVQLGEGEHPFGTRFARVRPTMRFEPSIYLEAIMRDVIQFGGKIQVRKFDTPRDLITLSEPVIVNCTGLGSKELFGDPELTPIKGQLVVLVPQPEVNYSVNGMLPRSDGIVLGHVMQRGVSSLEVDEEARREVMENHMRTFSAMQAPDPRALASLSGSVASESFAPPPVEAFFDCVS